jgi:hypothetical protein
MTQTEGLFKGTRGFLRLAVGLLLLLTALASGVYILARLLT